MPKGNIFEQIVLKPPQKDTKKQWTMKSFSLQRNSCQLLQHPHSKGTTLTQRQGAVRTGSTPVPGKE